MPYEIIYTNITTKSNPVVVYSPTASIDIQPVVDGDEYQISITPINALGVRGPTTFVQPNYIVVGKTLPPANVTGFTVSATKYGNYISWNANTEIDLLEYEVSKGPTFIGSTIINTGSTSTSFTDPVLTTGSTTYWIRAKDTTGHYSINAVSVIANINAPTNVMGFTVVGKRDGNYLTWDVVSGLYIDSYEIRKGLTYATSLVIGNSNTTAFIDANLISGDNTYWIRAIDTTGTFSSVASTVTLNIPIPNSVVGFNVLGTKLGAQLSWTTNSGIYVDSYEIREGATWDGGEVVGGTNTTAIIDASLTPGINQFWIKCKDITGTFSLNPTGTSLNIPNPNNIVGLTSIGKPDGSYISWVVDTGIYLDSYEIRKGDAWATALTVGNSNTNVFIDATLSLGTITYWVAIKDVLNIYGIPSSTTITPVVGVPALISNSILDTDYNISWSIPNSTYALSYYNIYIDGALHNITKSTSIQNAINWVGVRTFSISAVDIAGNESSQLVIPITVSPPVAPSITHQVVDNNILLYWTDCKATLPVSYYEIRKGVTYATAVVIGKISGLFSTLFETFSGNYTYWIVGIDSAGTYGTPNSLYATVNQPPDYILNSNLYSALTGGIKNIQNPLDKDASIILSTTGISRTIGTGWVGSRTKVGYAPTINAAAPTTKGYWEVVIQPGSTNTISMGISTLAASLVNNHLQVGSYVYNTNTGSKWVNGVETTAYGTAAIAGDVIGIALDMPAGTLTIYKNNISQGVLVSGISGTLYPIFNLYTNTDNIDVNYGYKQYTYFNTGLPLNISYSNSAIDIDDLSMPHNMTETWQSHFTSRPAWSPVNTPQGQINAGYPAYSQPMVTSGYYEEIIDYGTVLGGNRVTVLPDTRGSLNNPAITYTISVSTVGPRDTTPALYVWTNYVGTLSIFQINFRYVKIRIAATSTGVDLLNIRSINVTLDAKLKNDAGMCQCVSTDTGDGGRAGTQVNFNVPFVDISSVIANVNVSTPPSTAKYAIVDFQDITNPTGFRILLYDTAGTRATGDASWTAKGA